MKSESVVKSVRMTVELATIIEKRARLENRNFSNMIETLLIKILNETAKQSDVDLDKIRKFEFTKL